MPEIMLLDLGILYVIFLSPCLTVCGKYATICGMRTIDTSIFDFPTLIEQKYIYVDKTAQMY